MIDKPSATKVGPAAKQSSFQSQAEGPLAVTGLGTEAAHMSHVRADFK